jgi:hypothetical protein
VSGQLYTVKQSPKTIIIAGGSVTQIAINGTPTDLPVGVFKLGIGETGGICSRCCALTASGHATAAPPSRVMNSRRLKVAPGVKTTHGIVSQWSGSWNGVRGDVNCDQLFWAGNLGSGSHDLIKTGTPRPEQIFSGLPPKAAVERTSVNVSNVPKRL